jgi:hypothetical protein
MKQQFLDLKGLTELVGYLKDSIANKKVILPYASNTLFPSVGDINSVYIDTATNSIYRWDSSNKKYEILAKAVKSVSISEATENGKITLTVDGKKTTVPIHGLGSAAYTNSSAYSPAGHTHTKAQVGLGNVDNTADANKSVKHATTADSATTAGSAITATNVSGENATGDTARHVWFSRSDSETKRVYNDNFKYNPATNLLTTNITGSAASASNVPWTGVTGKPSTFTPSAHNHNDSTITSLNASKLFGTIDIARLPHGALERLVIVADDTARFKLTTANIQLGDTVKVTKTEKMYYVVDESKLSSEAGYAVYTAGTATSVPWSGVTGKPSSYPPASHNHDERYYTETEINNKLAKYLPVSGGSMNGAAMISWLDSGNWNKNNANVTFPVNRGGLSWSGQSDGIQLYAVETQNDNLELYLKFTDDNSNGLSIRNKDNTQTARISATGEITASKFVGNLAGTASAAPWSGITGKPATYPPSSHTHNYAGSSSSGGIAWNANALHLNPQTRQTSANYDLTNSNTYAYRINYSLATSTMTTGKPPADGHILTFGWDSDAGWGAQLAIGNTKNNHLYLRGSASVTANNKASSSWEDWRTVLDSSNYNSYAPTKTGTGASGTWGISVTGNAATATKLATARSINGTNFDGSGNITTATWGTARNVTIGSTKKSVNGGADVSWSLSEIGAAAASHSHSYLPLSGGTMTGALNFANGTWNAVGDDVAIGDMNVSGILGVMGKNGNTGIKLVQHGASTTSGSAAPGVTWTCTGNGTSTMSGTLSGTFSGSLSGTATAANYPTGFQSRVTSATWGNQTGTFLTDWHTSAGGDIQFRDNSGQLNVIIDGVFYQNEGKNLVLDSVNYSNYAATKSHTHNYAGSSSAGGNANAAVKLANARKIGSASFDGTADITLSQMGLNVPVEITKADYLAKKKAGTLNANTYYNVIDEYDSANVINDSSVTANSAFSSTKSEKTYAKKSTLVTTTLTASKWTGSSAPYTYVLPVSGATTSNIVEINYASNASSQAIEAYQNAMLADGGQTTNQITIKATEKPTVDIPITIVIRNDL